MNLTFGELVRRNREDMNLSQEEAAKIIKNKYDISISGAYLSMIERNERTNMTISVINAILDFFKLPIFAAASLFNQPLDFVQKIPLLGPIRAGLPLLADNHVIDQVEPPTGVKADFASTVEGDSMLYAGIHPGDIVFFRQALDANHGQVVAARYLDIDAGVNLKFYVKKNDQAFLRSANPDYEDILFTDKHCVVGIMVALIRDGSPILPDYERLLSVKEDVDGKWSEVITLAASHGINPEQVKSLLQMSLQAAFGLMKKK